MARPTKCTPKLTEAISMRLASGESLRSICEDKSMPAMSTILLWVVDDRDGFSEQYLRAREAAGYAHADHVVQMADQAASGQIEANAARAAMTGYIWAAERMAPKKHSPRQEVDHSSSDGSLTPQVIDASGLSDAALQELMNARKRDQAE